MATYTLNLDTYLVVYFKMGGKKVQPAYTGPAMQNVYRSSSTYNLHDLQHSGFVNSGFVCMYQFFNC